MATEKNPKNPIEYFCEFCHYNTFNKKDFNRHNLTQKHIRNSLATIGNSLATEKTLECEHCSKLYKDRTGLWRHKKTCLGKINYHDNDVNSKPSIDKDDIIMLLIKENSEFKSMLMEQQNMMLKVIENGTTNNSHNTTNSHNKAFNLNFFLNETCKNAMNITDFIDSIKLQLSDFMNVGEVGFVEGISSIIVKNLNSLDETVRPIHCTDQKRETFYVKDENIWEKEDEDKNRLKKMIKSVAFKNENLMRSYKEKYPDYNDPDSHRSDQYSKTVIEAMDSKEESREKIIKNISKATKIKTRVN
jgi:hypothetical protein